MENDLISYSNRRLPQKKFQMEDDIIFFQMEDDINFFKLKQWLWHRSGYPSYNLYNTHPHH